MGIKLTSAQLHVGRTEWPPNAWLWHWHGTNSLRQNQQSLTLTWHTVCPLEEEVNVDPTRLAYVRPSHELEVNLVADVVGQRDAVHQDKAWYIHGTSCLVLSMDRSWRADKTSWPLTGLSRSAKTSNS